METYIDNTYESLESKFPYELCFFDKIESPYSKSLVLCVFGFYLLIHIWIICFVIRYTVQHLLNRNIIPNFYEALSRSFEYCWRNASLLRSNHNGRPHNQRGANAQPDNEEALLRNLSSRSNP